MKTRDTHTHMLINEQTKKQMEWKETSHHTEDLLWQCCGGKKKILCFISITNSLVWSLCWSPFEECSSSSITNDQELLRISWTISAIVCRWCSLIIGPDPTDGLELDLVMKFLLSILAMEWRAFSYLTLCSLDMACWTTPCPSWWYLAIALFYYRYEQNWNSELGMD